MQRFLPTVILLLYLFGATEAGQFLKLSALLEHYSEHKQKNPAISFLDFMYMHYAGSDFDDSDQERDMKLPFKNPGSGNTKTDTIGYTGSALTLQRPDVKSAKPSPTHIVMLYNVYHASIWQPPKIA